MGVYLEKIGLFYLCSCFELFFEIIQFNTNNYNKLFLR